MKTYTKRLRDLFTNISLRMKFNLLFTLGILTVGLTSIALTIYLIHNYNQMIYAKSADSLGVVIDSISSDLQTV